jgi:uncharacterized membrane protein
MRKRVDFVIFAVLVAAFGFLLFAATPGLPERVATHFGADGRPNRFASRESFVAITAITVLLPVAVLQGIGFLFGKIPVSLINLPNREYWLSGDRRTKTLERLRTAMFEFGNATLAFLLFVTWSVIDANKGGADVRLGGAFGYGLFAFLAFVVLWICFLLRPYLKIPDGAGQT